MINLVKTQDGNYKIYYTGSTGSEARDFLVNKMFDLSKGTMEEREFFWRATNNKHEDEICSDIFSKNHADGTIEGGLSVSEGVAYQYFNGFKYIYAVTGEVIGTGSDGEPILRNAIALTKPSKTPSTKYLKREKKYNKLPIELEPLMVNMLAGIESAYGTPLENETETVVL